jgi:tetratricopeptide (TPR) repeat protein
MGNNIDPETSNNQPADLLSLACLANSYLDAGEPLHALEHLDTIINQGPPQPYYYMLRARAYSELNQYDKAAIDVAHAIEQEPDNATYYWQRGGYLLSHEVHQQGQLSDQGQSKTIGKILNDYTHSLERDPTNTAAWINLIEINVIARRWDDAIANFGASRNYITSPAFQVIRSFLGCLALSLAGDDISDEDRWALDDMDTSVSHGLYRFREIEALLQDLVAEEYAPAQVGKALEIRNSFLEHFWESTRQHQD